jgi:hypothetical protein
MSHLPNLSPLPALMSSLPNRTNITQYTYIPDMSRNGIPNRLRADAADSSVHDARTRRFLASLPTIIMGEV